MLEVGAKKGEWTLEERLLKVNALGKRSAYWNCTCSCGTAKLVRADNLRDNVSRSCGCKKLTTTLGRMRRNYGFE